MDSFGSSHNETSRNSPKVVFLIAFAVMGTLAACYSVMSAQNGYQVLISQNQVQGALFEQWMQTYGVTYDNPEVEQYRYQIFKSNYEIVMDTNAQNLGYTLALNQFADLTSEEFAALHCGYKPDTTRPQNVKILDTTGLPASVNWTAVGAVTPVKNQGTCGSCWAFSTTGSLEGLNFLTNSKLLSFSEQQLVDCSVAYGNLGCFGGEMDRAFRYVEANGIELEETYPYKGALDVVCHYNESDTVFKNGGHVDVQHNSVDQLMAAVAQQPISIAVEADQSSWQLYHSGVISSNCGQKLDHGVLAVGYGTTDNGTDYWIVKNSWGATWGMEGYLWILRSDDNLCGVLSDPSYPTMNSTAV